MLREVKVRPILRVTALGVLVVFGGSFAAYLAVNAILWVIWTWAGR